MSGRKEMAKGPAMTSLAIERCAWVQSQTPTVVRQSGAMSKVFGLISLTYTSFRAKDIRRYTDIFLAACPGRPFSVFRIAGKTAVTMDTGSSKKDCYLRGPLGIRKTGNKAGKEGRFGKRITAVCADSPSVPDSFYKRATPGLRNRWQSTS